MIEIAISLVGFLSLVALASVGLVVGARFAVDQWTPAKTDAWRAEDTKNTSSVTNSVEPARAATLAQVPLRRVSSQRASSPQSLKKPHENPISVDRYGALIWQPNRSEHARRHAVDQFGELPEDPDE